MLQDKNIIYQPLLSSQDGVIPATPLGPTFERMPRPELNDLSKFSMDPAKLADVFPETLEVSMFRQLPYAEEIRASVNSHRLMRLVSKLN